MEQQENGGNKRLSRSLSVDNPATGSNNPLVTINKDILFFGMKPILAPGKRGEEFEDTVEITNSTKSTVTFHVLEPLAGSSEDWYLTIGPKKGEIKKGKTEKVEFKLRVFARKKQVVQKIHITVQPKKTSTLVKRKADEEMSLLILKFSIEKDDTKDIPEEEDEDKVVISIVKPEEKPKEQTEHSSRRHSKASSKQSSVGDKSSSDNSYPNQSRSKTKTRRKSADIGRDGSHSDYDFSPKLDDPTPKEDLTAIGWFGDITREDAELKLSTHPKGTFLFRWSNRSKSYVLSHVLDNKQKIHHIAHITKKDPSSGSTAIMVREEDSNVREYNSLMHFIEEMRNHSILTIPVQNHNAYALSPVVSEEVKGP